MGGPLYRRFRWPHLLLIPLLLLAALALRECGDARLQSGAVTEGNTVYEISEQDGLYTLRLYNQRGRTVWSYGPADRYPQVEETEPGLWSVSVQAGTGLSTRWTLFYAAEEGKLSTPEYSVFDCRDGKMVFAGDRALIVREIFDDASAVELRDFSQPPASVAEPFVEARFTEDGTALTVTYLSGEDFHRVTETLPLP